MMKMMSRGVAVMVLVLGLAVPGGAQTVKIGSIFAKTGEAAKGNRTAIEGVRFAVEQLNSRGGILGRSVELLEYDNHSEPIYAKKMAEQAVADGVAAVIGANWSSHSLAMAPVLQAAKIPMLSPYSTNPQVTRIGDFIFRLCFLDSFQGQTLAAFAVRDLNAKTAAILVNASSRYSEGLAGFFKTYFTGLGGTILMETSYLKENEDFSPLMKQAAGLKPDILFIPGNIQDSGRAVKQARAAGITAPVLGGDGYGDEMFDIAGTALENTYFSVHWRKQNNRPQSREFVKLFRQAMGSDPDSGTALAADAVAIFADAAERAGSLDGAKVRDALTATQDFQGISGTIRFDPDRNPVKPAVILKFTKDDIAYVKTVVP